MQIETIAQTILKASEGNKLTNGTAFGDSVVLGVSDSPENWHEIPLEEYNNKMAEQNKTE